jgi:membrane protein required for colicin V production
MLAAVNAVDIIIFVVLGLAFVYGIIRGFVLQLVGIAFLVLGIVLAGRFGPGFGARLHAWFPALGAPFDRLIAVGLILIGAIVLGRILAMVFRGVLEKLKLLSYDRMLGGVLGVLEATLIIVIVLWVLVRIFDRTAEDEKPTGVAKAIYQAKTWPLVQKATDAVLPMVPEDLKEKARQGVDAVREELDDDEEE